MSQSQRQQLYVIPRTQGDITRFVWVAFLIFGFVTALTFVLVTQYTAWQFRFHPTLGTPAAMLLSWTSTSKARPANRTSWGKGPRESAGLLVSPGGGNSGTGRPHWPWAPRPNVGVFGGGLWPWRTRRCPVALHGLGRIFR